MAWTLLSPGCSAIQGEKRKTYHFEHQFNVESPAFRRSLDSLGAVMMPGNEVTILSNGDEIFPAMARAIRAASKSVSVEMYILKDDEAGREFCAALMDAARKGVEVRVLLDAVGSSPGKLADDMKAAGITLRTYRPIRPFTLHKSGKRTHRRILVVDGRISFTGGVGIDKRWLGNARNTNEWRDTMVQVTGPVASQMQAIFGEDWTFTTGEILAGDKFYPVVEASGSVPAQAIKASRGDPSSISKMLFYVAIQSADKSIHIQNAYFLPDGQLRAALVQAVSRGVDVQVMVPGSNIDIPLVRSASRLHYGELLRGGVKIFEYEPTMIHSKTMVVDGIYSTVGSINLDARSMRKNAEENFGFYDRGLAERMEKIFQEDLKRCKQITYRSWSHRGFLKRVTELISGLWEPYY